MKIKVKHLSPGTSFETIGPNPNRYMVLKRDEFDSMKEPRGENDVPVLRDDLIVTYINREHYVKDLELRRI